MKNYNKDLFKKDLANADWESIMEIKNIHDMFFKWEKLFVSVLDKHAPIRQHKVRNKYAPHINTELKRKMTQRDFYKRKHRSSKDPQDWQEYKKLRNIVNREIDKAKKDYFMHKISEAQNDVKATWKVLNSALGRQSKTTSIQQLRFKDTIYSQFSFFLLLSRAFKKAILLIIIQSHHSLMLDQQSLKFLGEEGNFSILHTHICISKLRY